ncbi:MAG: hypothetical protein R2692_04435 [Microbacterium sp.]
MPRFGHMPLVLGETGTKKLSKRDPQADLFLLLKGFIHEGLLNYLSLLGWSIATPTAMSSRATVVAAFDIADVNPNPAALSEGRSRSTATALRMLEASISPPTRSLSGRRRPDARPAPRPTSSRHWMPRRRSCRKRMQLLGEAPGPAQTTHPATRWSTTTMLSRPLPDNAGPVLVASVGALGARAGLPPRR